MPQDTIHEAEWARALDEHLLDVDTLQNWLGDQMRYQPNVTESALRALSGQLAMRSPLRAEPPYTVGELLVVLLTETPDIAIAARAALRDRILAAHSSAVSKIYWRQKDADREAATMDLDDDSPVDVGCEFDDA
jgi:hypothetical protein